VLLWHIHASGEQPLDVQRDRSSRAVLALFDRLALGDYPR